MRVATAAVFLAATLAGQETAPTKATLLPWEKDLATALQHSAADDRPAIAYFTFDG